MDKWSGLRRQLRELEGQDLLRRMTVFDSPRDGRAVAEGAPVRLFSSNSYLDLGREPAVTAFAAEILERYGVGAGGSRLTTGTTRVHTLLEETIAAFKGREAALVFHAGYMANVGAISALAGPGDVIYSDALNHASIIDGCRLSRAEVVVYRHNDMDDLERKILARPGRGGLIVSDGVFSMDGDIVDLPRLTWLADQHGLLSMIDEAHATGVIGATGRGTEEHYHMEGRVDVLMGTLSKAVGSEGGFLCGSRLLVDYLLNRARSFLFSTALSPVSAAAAVQGLRLIAEQPERVRRLQDNIALFCRALRERGIPAASETAIIPIVIGDEGAALAAMERLRAEGFFVSAIRYPTVARGSARLRVTLTAGHTGRELAALAEALGRCITPGEELER